MGSSIWAPSKDVNKYVVDGELLKKVEGEVSGERAWDLVSKISRFHRIRGGGKGSGYNQCVDWLAGELGKIEGLEVEVVKFKSDGVLKYFQWLSPLGWRATEAELWLTEPEERLVSRFSEDAVCLMPYSKGGEVESDVVYVGEGKSDGDYEGKDVEGRLVFAVGGNGTKVHREAVLKRGAAGVLVGPSDRADRMEYPDLIEVSRLDTKGEEVEKAGFGFALSRRQVKELLPLFEGDETVRMRARVDAELIEGEMPTIDARFVGTELPGQEVILMGHLDHYKPGANDNASGCAGLVEIIRNIADLVGRGKIPPPRRTVRFLFLPELHGATAYTSRHQDVGERGLAGINLDMIGEDYGLCKANFNLTCSPYSVPGYVDDVLADLLPWLEGEGFYEPRGSKYRFNHRVQGYSGGSDHVMFNDSAFSVPSVMLGHSNVFHHTNMDTTETCDPTEMKRIICLAEAAALFLANAGDEEALRVAREVYGQAGVRMAETTKESLQLLQGQASDPEGRLAEVHWNAAQYPGLQADVEAGNVRKAKELCEGEEAKEMIDGLADGLLVQAAREKARIDTAYGLLLERHGLAEEPYAPDKLYGEAAKLKPRRLFKGSLSNAVQRIREELGDERAGWYDGYVVGPMRGLGSRAFEILNLMDGERSLLEIRHLVSFEFQETGVEFLLHFAEDLREMGLIAYI